MCGEFDWQTPGQVAQQVATNLMGSLTVTKQVPVMDIIIYIIIIIIIVQGVPKKMSFLGKIAITTLKLIQNANVGGVLENSGYLLPDGHRDFQN